MLLGEVGPAERHEDELGVGELPEQEVADPLLAAGADQQIGVGDAGRARDARANSCLVDRRRDRAARLRLARQPARGLGDLAPAAVVERHDRR